MSTHGERPERVARVAVGELAHLLVVGVAFGHRLLKDRRVRRRADDRVLVDQALQVSCRGSTRARASRSTRSVPASTVPVAAYCPSALPFLCRSEQRSRSRGDVLDGEAELLEDLRSGRARAEAVDSEHVAAIAHPPPPAQAHARLDRQAGADARPVAPALGSRPTGLRTAPCTASTRPACASPPRPASARPGASAGPPRRWRSGSARGRPHRARNPTTRTRPAPARSPAPAPRRRGRARVCPAGRAAAPPGRPRAPARPATPARSRSRRPAGSPTARGSPAARRSARPAGASVRPRRGRPSRASTPTRLAAPSAPTAARTRACSRRTSGTSSRTA